MVSRDLPYEGQASNFLGEEAREHSKIWKILFRSFTYAHFFRAPQPTYSAPAIENPSTYIDDVLSEELFYQFWQVIQPNFDLCFYACVCRWQGSMTGVSVNHPLPYFSNLGISLNLKLADSSRVGSCSTNSRGCPCLHSIAPWLQVQIPKADSY